MIKRKVRNQIKEWLKEQTRYRMGGKNYLKYLKLVDILCEERANWLMESMVFYLEGVQEEIVNNANRYLEF